MAESNYPAVIKKLFTRSAIGRRTKKRVKFYTPLLEKILVDLFAEGKLFYYLQGSEKMHIYQNATRTYALNFTKLFSYSKRRERDQDIKPFMKNHIYHLLKDIFD
ncbi:DUF6577 family protein [Cyclobacterium sp. SYSU L10401]|uniref:DUF6577 family protein n=1 Tax=Cyclobacterium sp. SYSU L10401 TaxID=2678657 RepID=UPI00293BE44E|nr:DUF6577 family protein [Cyclobacterium sp. SYSU L10401]